MLNYSNKNTSRTSMKATLDEAYIISSIQHMDNFLNTIKRNYKPVSDGITNKLWIFWN